MEEKKQKTDLKKPFAKIFIPIIILVVIVGIWLLKNAEKQEPTGIDISADDTKDEINPDFDLHVTEEINLEKLKNNGLPIIIDFGADSCIPCKEMAPVLSKLNENLKGKAIIKFVDVWKYKELAQGYPIKVIPTQIFFDKEGNPFVPSKTLDMKMNIYTLKDTNEHVFTTHEGGMTEKMILDVLKEMGME